MNPISTAHYRLDQSTVLCASGLPAAFREFLKAHEYANDLKTNVWEFALDLRCLRRSKVTRNDIRWLMKAGLVSHAVETTSDSEGRTFNQRTDSALCKASCFVLTPKGVALGQSIWPKQNEPPENGAPQRAAKETSSAVEQPTLTPHWDSQRQELRVGLVVVKRFRVPATSQEAILSAFEEEDWPVRIDDPLPGHPEFDRKRRLHNAINALNRNQVHRMIHFLGDGRGLGVRWEFKTPSPRPLKLG